MDDNEEPAHPQETQNAPENISSPLGRRIIEQKLRKKIYVEHFPGKAGATIENDSLRNYGFTAYAHHENIYYPWISEIDWKVAQWAKLRGPGSTATSELLNIPDVSNFTLMCSYLFIFCL